MSSKRREALGPDRPPAPLVPRTRKGQPYNAPPTNAPPRAPPYFASTAAYPPVAATPTRTTSQPLHTMSLGAITPNTLLFRDSQGPLHPAPPPSKPGEITPNLLLLPDSQFAMTQPAGMVTAAYPTTAAPSVKVPEPNRCAEEKHEFATHYGAGGILISVLCFPMGLTALFFDQDKRCRRCGYRTDRHGDPMPPP